MTLYTIGSLQIEVAPFNVHEVSDSGVTEYAVKPVAGAEPPLEFVGEGSNEMSMTGRLFPKSLGGMDELETLQTMRRSGKPQFVMKGDGTPLGWWAITRVSSRSSYLARDGIGKQVEVSIDMTRGGKPPAKSYFSLIIGMLP